MMTPLQRSLSTMTDPAAVTMAHWSAALCYDIPQVQGPFLPTHRPSAIVAFT